MYLSKEESIFPGNQDQAVTHHAMALMLAESFEDAIFLINIKTSISKVLETESRKKNTNTAPRSAHISFIARN